MKQKISKTEKELVNLLLTDKDCLRKFIQNSSIGASHFSGDYKKIVALILDTYKKHKVSLTRDHFKQWNSDTNKVPKDRIALELAFDGCYIAATAADNYPHLVEQLQKSTTDSQTSQALEILKVNVKNYGTLKAVEILKNDCEKILSVSDNPIEQELQQHKRFPASVLPKDLQTYCESVSDTMSVPPEWLAGSILAVSSSLLGNKVTLSAGFGGWMVRPYFSYIVVCPNGSNKTHPMLKVMSYIFDKDNAEKDKYQTAKKQYDNALYNARKNKQVYEESAPIRKRYFVNDTTIEQLSRALNDNPQGLLWYVNEIAGLFNGLNQYKGGKGNDAQRFIDILDGVNYSVIRGDADLSVNKPYINILGSTQPQVIRQIMNHQKDNGLAYRFCYNYSPKNIYKVKANPPQNIDGYLNSYLSRLNSLPLMPYVLHFDNAAYQKAIDYMNNDFADLQAKYNCPVISGIISKIRTQFMNFCLLLHCMNNHIDCLTVNAQTVEQAYRLAMYYMYHNYLTLATNSTVDGGSAVNNQTDYDRVLKSISNGVTTVRGIQEKTRIKSDAIRQIFQKLEKDGIGTCQISEQGRDKDKVSGFVIKTA